MFVNGSLSELSFQNSRQSRKSEPTARDIAAEVDHALASNCQKMTCNVCRDILGCGLVSTVNLI